MRINVSDVKLGILDYGLFDVEIKLVEDSNKLTLSKDRFYKVLDTGHLVNDCKNFVHLRDIDVPFECFINETEELDEAIKKNSILGERYSLATKEKIFYTLAKELEAFLNASERGH